MGILSIVFEISEYKPIWFSIWLLKSFNKTWEVCVISSSLLDRESKEAENSEYVLAGDCSALNWWNSEMSCIASLEFKCHS